MVGQVTCRSYTGGAGLDQSGSAFSKDINIKLSIQVKTVIEAMRLMHIMMFILNKVKKVEKIK